MIEKKVSVSKFRKDLGVSTTSSIISFVISLGLTPIMTRLYTPEDYGIFSLINTISMFLATLALFSLQSAFPLEKSFIRRVQLLGTLTGIIVLTFFILSILSILGVILIDSVSWHFLFLPILVLAVMSQRIFFSLSVSHEKFTHIAKSRVIHPFIAKIFSIIAALISQSNAVFLVLFESLGYFIQTYILFKNKESKNVKRYIKNILDFSRYKKALHRYSHFASYFHLSNLLSATFLMMQPLIISVNYSAQETGLFSLANSMIALPAQLISMATASVIYAKMIKLNNEHKDISTFILKVILIFFCLGLIPYSIINKFGMELFSLVFGKEWIESGKIASILSYSLFVYFIYLPINSIFRVKNRMTLKFKIDFIFLIGIPIIFFIYSIQNEFVNAVKLLAVLIMFYYLVSIFIAINISRGKDSCENIN